MNAFEEFMFETTSASTTNYRQENFINTWIKSVCVSEPGRTGNLKGLNLVGFRILKIFYNFSKLEIS